MTEHHRIGQQDQPSECAAGREFFDVPKGWEPRFRLASALCRTSPVHSGADRSETDYCTDCLLHADAILDEDDYEDVVVEAIRDEQDERAERKIAPPQTAGSDEVSE